MQEECALTTQLSTGAATAGRRRLRIFALRRHPIARESVASREDQNAALANLVSERMPWLQFGVWRRSLVTESRVWRCISLLTFTIAPLSR